MAQAVGIKRYFAPLNRSIFSSMFGLVDVVAGILFETRVVKFTRLEI
jgi:hypothetical protein